MKAIEARLPAGLLREHERALRRFVGGTEPAAAQLRAGQRLGGADAKQGIAESIGLVHGDGKIGGGRGRSPDRDERRAASHLRAQDRGRAAAGNGQLDGLLPGAPGGLGLALGEVPVAEGGLVIGGLLVVACLTHPGPGLIELRLRLREPSQLRQGDRLPSRCPS